MPAGDLQEQAAPPRAGGHLKPMPAGKEWVLGVLPHRQCSASSWCRRCRYAGTCTPAGPTHLVTQGPTGSGTTAVKLPRHTHKPKACCAASVCCACQDEQEAASKPTHVQLLGPSCWARALMEQVACIALLRQGNTSSMPRTRLELPQRAGMVVAPVYEEHGHLVARTPPKLTTPRNATASVRGALT